jgi:integrase/recombinase XerC
MPVTLADLIALVASVCNIDAVWHTTDGVICVAVDIGAYRRYMQGRGYARGYTWTRIAVARDWLEYTDDTLVADHRQVERWVAGRHVSAGTQRNYLVALRGFYRWARREGLCDVDPTELADRPPIPRRLPRPAAERDIARLVATGDVQLCALVALMSCAGLRCVECSRLDWGDVDLAAGSVIVFGKGSRERLIDLSPDVVRALAALKLAGTTTAVFVGPTGARMSPARVSQRVARAATAQGLSVRAHQLRHRCATQALAAADGDLLAVRDLLGHSSVSTTQVYTAVIPGRTAKASRALKLPA